MDDQLLWALRNERQNAAAGLGQNLANIYNQQKETEFKQAAIKWFGDGEITADKVQQFLEHYPNHSMDVLKIAGDAATIRTAQSMKDAGKSFMSFMDSHDMKKIDEKDIMEFVKSNPYLADNSEAQQIFFTQFVPKLLEIKKQYEPKIFQTDPRKNTWESIGGVTYLKTPGKQEEEANITMTSPDGYVGNYTPAEAKILKGKGFIRGKREVGQETEWNVYVTDLMKQTNPQTNKPYTRTEAIEKYKLIQPEKEPTHVDMGDRVEFYNKNGERIRIVKKGVPPGSVPTHEETASKDQEKLSRAQLMAGRDMGMRYVKDEFGGIWRKDGEPVPNEQIIKEYNDLVQKYYSQATGGKSPLPTGGPSSYIKRVLKK